MRTRGRESERFGVTTGPGRRPCSSSQCREAGTGVTRNESGRRAECCGKIGKVTRSEDQTAADLAVTLRPQLLEQRVWEPKGRLGQWNNNVIGAAVTHWHDREALKAYCGHLLGLACITIRSLNESLEGRVDGCRELIEEILDGRSEPQVALSALAGTGDDRQQGIERRLEDAAAAVAEVDAPAERGGQWEARTIKNRASKTYWPWLFEKIVEREAKAIEQSSAPRARRSPTVPRITYDRLKDAVLQDDLPAVVALVGPNGYGKTTIARSLLEDENVRHHFGGGTHFVELGPACSKERVAKLLNDLIAKVGRERPSFTEPDQAGQCFAETVAGGKHLLVVDNVWEHDALKPFLWGDGICRVVTTPNQYALPPSPQLRQEHMLEVAEMTPQAIEKLLREKVVGLVAGDPGLEQLSKRLYGWPLLAENYAGILQDLIWIGVSPEDAVRKLLNDFREDLGPWLDIADEAGRTQTLDSSMAEGIKNLDLHVDLKAAKLKPSEVYFTLGAFPAAVEIPVEVLNRLWRKRYGLSHRQSKDFVRQLHRRSLAISDPRDDTLRLHDARRTYLARSLGRSGRRVHKDLAEELARPKSMSSQRAVDYATCYRTTHLAAAGMNDELIRICSDVRRVAEKAHACGPPSVLLDLRLIEATGEPIRAAHEARNRAAHLLDAAHLLHDVKALDDMISTLDLQVARTFPRTEQVTARMHDDTVMTDWITAEGRSTDGPVDSGLTVGAITSLSIAADPELGELLVAGGEDGLLRVWSPTRNEPVAVARGHTGWIDATACSGREGTCFSGGEDTRVRKWDLRTGELLDVFLGHSARVRAVAVTPDGRRVVSGDASGLAILWATGARRARVELDPAVGGITAVAIAPRNRYVAVAGAEGIAIARIAFDKPMQWDRRPVEWCRSVAFAEGGSILVVGEAEGDVSRWSFGDRLTLIERRDACDRMRSMDVSDKGSEAVGCEDGTVRYWNGRTRQGRIFRTSEEVDWVRAVAFGPGRWLFAGCEDGVVRGWDTAAEGDTAQRRLGRPKRVAWAAAASPDRQKIALGWSDGRIDVSDRGRDDVVSVDAGPGRVWAVDVSDEKVLAAACGDGSVRVWAEKEGVFDLQAETPPRPPTWSTVVGLGGERVVVGRGDGSLQVVDLRGSHVRRRKVNVGHRGRVRALAVSDDGRWLLSGGGDGSVALTALDPKHPRRVSELLPKDPRKWVRATGLAPGASLGAAGLGSGLIKVWDLQPLVEGRRRAKARVVCDLTGHQGRILALAFCSPRRLLSAAADGTVRLWRLKDGQQISCTRVAPSLLTAGTSKSGRSLLAVSTAGVASFEVPIVRTARKT